MKKLLLTLLLTLGFIGNSHSNILDDLLGNLPTSDVKLYDKSLERVGEIEGSGEWSRNVSGVHFKAKIKNLNQEKSIKEVYIKIKTLDCKKGCKDCITANVGIYEVLYDDGIFGGLGSFNNILRPNTVFQINFNFGDLTQERTYVQSKGNETCFNTSIDKVKGYHIFE